jgi:CRP-like cAMP-binding protein
MPVALTKDEWLGGNLILSAVPVEGRKTSLPHLELVELRSGQSLYRTAERLNYLYFPLDSVVATVGVDRKGGTAEYVLTGKEGFVGLNAFLGDSRAGGDVIVVLPGQSYRLVVPPLREAFERSPALRKVILRYASSRMFQTSQTSMCNAHHSVRQRLCRWLLQVLDRLNSSELRITHELLGNVLGVRREAVSIAAERLEARKAIRCSRGRMLVTDRRMLQALCCECYAELKRDLDLMARDIAGI